MDHLLGMPGFGHTTFSLLNSQLGCFGCLEGISLANQRAPGGLGSGILEALVKLSSLAPGELSITSQTGILLQNCLSRALVPSGIRGSRREL